MLSLNRRLFEKLFAKRRWNTIKRIFEYSNSELEFGIRTPNSYPLDLQLVLFWLANPDNER